MGIRTFCLRDRWGVVVVGGGGGDLGRRGRCMTRTWILSILSTSLQAVTINIKAGMYFRFKGKILPFFFSFSFLSERYCACFTKGSRKRIKSKKNQTNKNCYTLPQGMYCNTTINLKTNILSNNPHTNVKHFQRINFNSRKIQNGR